MKPASAGLTFLIGCCLLVATAAIAFSVGAPPWLVGVFGFVGALTVSAGIIYRAIHRLPPE